MVSKKFSLIALLLFGCFLVQAQTKKDLKKESEKPSGAGSSSTISDAELNNILLQKFSGDVNQYSSMEAALASPEKVVELDLRNKELTSLPAGISKLVNLKKLDLSGNKISALGNELSGLSNLEILDLSNNSLTSVPASVCSIKNLKTIYLTGNQIKSLGSELACLKGLEKLFAANNGLTSVSADIGNLKDLKFLYLHNNDLTSLPEQIGDLTKLQVLTVQNNALASYPDFIDKLTLLYHFEFEPQNSLELEKEKLRMDLIEQAYENAGIRNRKIDGQHMGRSDNKGSTRSSLLGGRKQEGNKGSRNEAGTAMIADGKTLKQPKPSLWKDRSFGGVYFGRLLSFSGPGSTGSFGVEYLKMFSRHVGFSTGLSRISVPSVYILGYNEILTKERFLSVPALLHLGIGNTFRVSTELGVHFSKNLDASSRSYYTKYDIAPHTGLRLNLVLGKTVNLFTSTHLLLYPFSELSAVNVVSGVSVAF